MSIKIWKRGDNKKEQQDISQYERALIKTASFESCEIVALFFHIKFQEKAYADLISIVEKKMP